MSRESPQRTVALLIIWVLMIGLLMLGKFACTGYVWGQEPTKKFISLPSIYVYPNPFRTSFTIKATKANTLYIYDVNGVLKKTLHVEKKGFIRNVYLNIPTGVYFIRDNNGQTIKLVRIK